MLNELKKLYNEGTIRAIDYYFSKFIHQLDSHPIVTLLSALVSYQLGLGNICININSLSNQNPIFNSKEAHKNLLRLSGTVIKNWPTAIESSITVGDGSQPTPLVVNGNRIYLFRYWLYEQKLVHYLKNKISQSSTCYSKTFLENITKNASLLFYRDYNTLYDKLNIDKTPSQKQTVADCLDVVSGDDLFWDEIESCLQDSIKEKNPEILNKLDDLIPEKNCINYQKIAAVLATMQKFTLISGGPGTGKTTTVIKAIALLIPILAEEKNMNLEYQIPIIRLAAPTGKAATRLTESISGAINNLRCSPLIKNAIPTEAMTLHALLGAKPYDATFLHHKNNPLHLDVLIIDEASMIDLYMMAHLIDAMPNDAHLILLGDHNQLSSVEAGGILGDLCATVNQGYNQQLTNYLIQLTGFEKLQWKNKCERPISNHLCLLRKSYRFNEKSDIGILAKSVNEGNVKTALEILNQNIHTTNTIFGSKDISFVPFDLNNKNTNAYQHTLNFQAQVVNATIDSYQNYLKMIHQQKYDPKSVIETFQKSRLLCAFREGPLGVSILNQKITEQIYKRSLISENAAWFLGRPILVTQNDYELGLYNGDIGLTLANEKGQPMVYFIFPDRELRGILPSMLPDHETAFVMTIHKSQGSEFDHALLLIPDTVTSLLSRELLYTGITRAKKQLSLFASTEAIRKAVEQKSPRTSGLAEHLHALQTKTA